MRFAMRGGLSVAIAIYAFILLESLPFIPESRTSSH